MAKAKTPQEAVVEYFSNIKYYEDSNKLIVLLPEGLTIDKNELDDEDNKLNLELSMDGLEVVRFVVEVKTPKDTEDVLVLQEEDAKFFAEND